MYKITPENIPQIRDWLKNRGGIAIWKSINLSNPGYSVTTPVLDSTGHPKEKPSWQVANQPDQIITKPEEIEVTTYKEVKRFRVAIRRSSNWMLMKLTDASTKKLNNWLGKFEKSVYRFDYPTQEAVISVPDKTIPFTMED